MKINDSIQFNNIPDDLKDHDHWLCWKEEKVKGRKKPSKVPKNPISGENLSVTGGTFTFKEASKAFKKKLFPFTGIGFVFDDDDFVGIDLDNCRNVETGEIDSSAMDIVKKLNSYTEISPSGTGLHIFVKGKLPPGKRRKGKIEMYDSNRYFTVTGQHLKGTAREVNFRKKALEDVYSIFLGDTSKAARLINGDWSGYPSQSEADLAFCNILARQTNCNFNEIDKKFRESKLFRDKWDKKHYSDGKTYGEQTIEKAIDSLKQYGIDNKRMKHLLSQRQYGKNGAPVFQPLLEARIFRQDKHLLFSNEQLLMYENGWYKPFHDRFYLQKIEEQIHEFHNGRRNKAKEILEVLKDQLHNEDEPVNTNPMLVNVKNGILDIEKLELTPHTPDIVFTYQINANYNPDAKCERFKQFLAEVLVKEKSLEPDERLIRLVQQFIGYCLYSKVRFHVCLMLYGKGRNGKSVLVFVITELLKGLASQVHFEEIGCDKFATADLPGKLVNISSEISANARLSDGQIKGIIAGDELRAQRKFQPAFDFRPIAKHIITTNNLPRSKDKSLGYFARFIIIMFHRTFLTRKEIKALDDKEWAENCLKCDPFLEDKLVGELDGILLWAIDGLKDLLKNKGFCSSRQVDKLKKVFMVRCSSIDSFFDEMVDDSDSTIDTKLNILRQKYIAYCKEYKIPPDTSRQFDNAVKNLGYEIKPLKQNIRYVRGVTLKKTQVNEVT